MSIAIDPQPIESSTREALKQFAISVFELAAPLGAEAFAEGPAHDAALDLVRDADDALGTEVAGKIASELDSAGFDIGDAHVTTQFASFAQGKVASPIAEITVTKKRVIPLLSTIAKTGAISATCTLTTTLSYESPDDKGQRIVSSMAKVSLNLDYTSPKKTVTITAA